MTLPVLDLLRLNFPESKITVVAGPRPKEIFQDNPNINRFIIYNKQARLREKLRLFNNLRGEGFDLIVDLRNSLFGMLLPAKYKTSPFLIIPKNIKHMRDRHIYKIQNPKSKIKNKSKIQISNIETKSLFISQQDEEYINQTLKENNIGPQDKIVMIAAGARSHIKRWSKEKFVKLIALLQEEFAVKIILVGDKDDVFINEYITQHSPGAILDLSAKTTLNQLAYLLKKARLLIGNDSAVLHLGSYLNIPIVAIFGPTNEEKYGPWSQVKTIVKKEIFCRPCAKALCKLGTLDCMSLIQVEDVLRAIRKVLITDYRLPPACRQAGTDYRYKRILIVRTDRIGDVLLSTPVIKALRDAWPYAYIAMIVSPYAKEIVEGNPFLDEVIIYNKDGKHRSALRTIKFALNLKKKKFDLAVILHPTNRVHLVSFLAGIKRRIGYDRKLGFLLTDKIKHSKQLGEKHEVEYSLDLVRYLGIMPEDKNLFMPIKPASEVWVEELFKQEKIGQTDKLLAIHPGASCLSKVWPSERFADVADRLTQNYGFKVLIISGAKDIALAQNVMKNMHHPVINLAGKTSVSQLASLLKRCQLFISNDSGPVHIASSVGTPVISIFGRDQEGLSPRRWGPVGLKDRILHKEVGCIECLAHNCAKEFICLKAIVVDEVLKVADSILKG